MGWQDIEADCPGCNEPITPGEGRMAHWPPGEPMTSDTPPLKQWHDADCYQRDQAKGGGA